MCTLYDSNARLRFCRYTSAATCQALIFYHGALMPNTQYLSLFKNLQQQSNLDLWVLLPGFALDTPNPVTIHQATSDALATAHQGGLPKDAPLFFGGHSLGSIMSQNFVATLASVEPTWQVSISAGSCQSFFSHALS